MKNNRGFTLIELLVVIAIIGMLSTIILASLNSARTKAADSAVKENLHNLRAQAVLYYENNGNYTVLCTDGKVLSIYNAAKAAGGPDGRCNNSPGVNGAWAADVELKGAGGFWCVDSVGNAKAEPGALGAGDTLCSP